MTKENVKVIIVDDDTETSIIVKEMIQACDEIMVIGRNTQSDFFELHMCHEPPTPYNAVLKAPTEHGAYRQFIKRDKRKNFKV
jgi:hypothetical protein